MNASRYHSALVGRLCLWPFLRNFIFFLIIFMASVAQLDARPGGRWFNPRRGRQHSFVEIDHEIFSMVILSFPLI